MRRAVLLALAVLGAGCADFRKPSDLRHAQVLAVRAGRPRIPAGERTKIDLLVTDDLGVPAEVAPDALAVAPDPRDPTRPIPPPVAALISHEDDGWYVSAPSEEGLAAARALLGLPPDALLVLPVEARITLAGALRISDKAVVLGADASNPIVTTLTVDDVPVADDGVRTAVGMNRRLAVAADGTGMLGYAWYAAAGELELYRSASPRLVAAKPGAGALLCVVRDDRGGVAWKQTTLTIE